MCVVRVVIGRGCAHVREAHKSSFRRWWHNGFDITLHNLFLYKYACISIPLSSRGAQPELQNRGASGGAGFWLMTFEEGVLKSSRRHSK